MSFQPGLPMQMTRPIYATTSVPSGTMMVQVAPVRPVTMVPVSQMMMRSVIRPVITQSQTFIPTMQPQALAHVVTNHPQILQRANQQVWIQTEPQKATFIHQPKEIIKEPVLIANHNQPATDNNNSNEPAITVFVGNITDRASDTLVRQILMKCGSVYAWKRVQGTSGKLQAFGFCEYKDPESALRAIHILHDLQLGDKKLLVKVDAKTQERIDEWKKDKDMKTEEDGSFKLPGVKEAIVGIQALMQGYSNELALPKQTALEKESAVQVLKPDPTVRESRNIEGNLDELQLEEDQKSFISKEIRFFRESQKQHDERLKSLKEERTRYRPDLLRNRIRINRSDRDERDRRPQRSSSRRSVSPACAKPDGRRTPTRDGGRSSPDRLLPSRRISPRRTPRRRSRTRSRSLRKRSSSLRRTRSRSSSWRRSRSRSRRRSRTRSYYSSRRRTRSRSRGRSRSSSRSSRWRSRSKSSSYTDRSRSTSDDSSRRRSVSDSPPRRRSRSKSYSTRRRSRSRSARRRLRSDSRSSRRRTRSRSRTRWRSRSRSRSRKKKSFTRSPSPWSSSEDSAIEEDRKELEERIAKKQASYQKRLEAVETREKQTDALRSSREQQKLLERRALVKEAKRIREFLADYDDDCDDDEFYAGEELTKRLQAREEEMRADAEDRKKEKEEIELLREHLVMENHPDVDGLLEEVLADSYDVWMPPLEANFSSKDSPSSASHRTSVSSRTSDQNRLSLGLNSHKTEVDSGDAQTTRSSKKSNQRDRLIPSLKPIEAHSSISKLTSNVKLKFKQSPAKLSNRRSRAPSEDTSTSKRQTTASESRSFNKIISKNPKVIVPSMFDDVESQDDVSKSKKFLPRQVTSGDKKSTKSAATKTRTSEERRRLVRTLIEKIPMDKEDLFDYEVDWSMLDTTLMEKRIQPWISKRILEYIGKEETTLVEFICSKIVPGSSPRRILEDLSMVLDDEAEIFVVKMWRLLVYETEAKREGLAKP